MDAPLAARLPLEVLHRVRDVGARAVDPGEPSASSSRRPAGPTNGGPASPGRPAARRQQRRRARLSFAEHHLVPVRQSGQAGSPPPPPGARGARGVLPQQCVCRRPRRHVRGTSGQPLLHRVVDSPIDMVSAMSVNGTPSRASRACGEGRRQRRRGAVRARHRAGRACAARARDRRRRVRRRRALGRRRVRRQARAPRDDRERRRRTMLEWTPQWSVKRSNELGEEQGAMISITGDPEPELLSDLDQERVGKARQVRSPEAHLRNVMAAQVQLDDRQLPERGLGARRCSASPTSSGCGSDVERAVRLDEADPVAAWERAHRAARASVRGAERARLRRGPLPRPRHRSHDRAEPEVALALGATRRRRSAGAHAERADRGGLHDAGLAACGGHGPLDDAARAARATSSATSS